MENDFVGVGWAFPPRVNGSGRIALVRHERELEEAMRIILLTYPGERPMRPEFGCEVHDLVFDTIDAAMVGQMDTAIRKALDRWEPRLEVTDIGFDLSEMGEGRLEITIGYRIRATNAKYNLVYPFYVIPAEESE